MISHPGIIIRGPEGTVSTGQVGCINNISGPSHPDECDQHPELPICIPDDQ
jgi:hypothetical protein